MFLSFAYHFCWSIWFIYFCRLGAFVALCRLSLVVVCWGYSLLWYLVFSLWWLLLLRSTGSRCAGLSVCSAQAQQLRHMGLVGLWPVGSSRTRNWTRVFCSSRYILIYCATREVGKVTFPFILTNILWGRLLFLSSFHREANQNIEWINYFPKVI